MPTRTSGDSPDHPPRHAAPTGAGHGRHTAAAPTGRHARRAEGAHGGPAPRSRRRAGATRSRAADPGYTGGHRLAGATRATRRRLPLRPVVAGVLLIAVASVLTQLGIKIEFGSGDSASAALKSQFTVANGTIRKATGSPRPDTGSQATLWSNDSTATTTLQGSGRVVVGAIGDECGGWPTVEVTVDGRRVGASTIVDAKNYGTYPVGQMVAEGTHSVVLRLVNDRYDPPNCDRNLHIGYARMETTTDAAPAPIPSFRPTEQPIPTLDPPAPVPTTPKPSSSAPTSTSAPAPPAPPAPTGPAPGPPSTGRPGPANTGVPDGTKLTVHNGDLSITKDGTVIDSLDINGYLKINASNVTVRRSIIRGGPYATGPGVAALVSAYGNHRNFVIEDSTLVAARPSPYLDGIKGRNFTARRLDVSNVVDTSLIFGDNVLIENSWMHGTTYYKPFAGTWDNQTHNDNLQIEGGTNIVVRNNVFESAHNAGIMMTQNYSRTSDVRITGNWLSGGSCTVNLSEKGKGPFKGIRLEGNRFGSSSIAGCAVIAPSTSDVTVNGDVFEATGARVTIRKGT